MFSGQSDFRVTTLKFHPKDHNVFLCGGFSSEIKAWDMRTGKVTPFFSGCGECSCVFVCACLCVCVHMPVHSHGYIEQKLALGSSGSITLYFENLNGTWALLMRGGWLARALQRSTCSCLPNSECAISCHTP